MNDEILAKMTADIAEVLRTHIPGAELVTLRSEIAASKSKTFAQVFGFTPGARGIFTISSELTHPPPTPSKLNLRCTTAK
ncbi:hypothetical protein [Candidatus Thiothrix anitrata]|uniref:Uncharacterized protein n=1 Tax=Candidatus Thiothrix anitrata TaxID=2823902 RepID=A0ABX7WZL1_9GAMM|nr:hypothetical protein [Candidatus Thiothrix anitrata]QTR49055.1 hypothetical protein J8380_12315 [Candidatus Thiothrix anitrata]